MHQEHHLSHSDAMRIISVIQQKLEQDGKGAAVAVADEHGELLAFVRTDGCPLPSILIAQNKAYTAARERQPSGRVGERSRSEGFPMTNFGELRYTAWGGGLPIVYGGKVVGAVAVSGLSEAEDVALAQLGVDLFA
jgi:glc operon protein GlcG